MKCQFCGHEESRVIDSRAADEGTTIRRRRECIECKKRFTTYEKVEVIPLIVVKKDGARQVFSRDKMLSGIIRACEKRPVPRAVLDQLADEVEAMAYESPLKEISSKQIGESIMKRLKRLDEVAYVRFASVYRQFKDINTFMAELKNLIGERKL